MKIFDPGTLARWRQWLARHHDSQSEIWLVFHKREKRGIGVPGKHRTARQPIERTDALDEALCFGWVDSLIKRIDEHRYAVKFTPRRPDSRWSAINRKRYADLQAAGRLRPSGTARAPTDRTYAPKPEWRATFPRYIRVALRRSPVAWRQFHELPPSERRRYLGWIDTAKKDETKLRRLEEVVRLLAAGRRLGLK